MPTDEMTTQTEAEREHARLVALDQRLRSVENVLRASTVYTTPLTFTHELRRLGIENPASVTHEVFRTAGLVIDSAVSQMKENLTVHEGREAAFQTMSDSYDTVGAYAQRFWYGSIGISEASVNLLHNRSGFKNALRFFLEAMYEHAALEMWLDADNGSCELASTTTDGVRDYNRFFVPCAGSMFGYTTRSDWDEAYACARLFMAVREDPDYSAGWLVGRQQDGVATRRHDELRRYLSGVFHCSNCGDIGDTTSGMQVSGDWVCDGCSDQVSDCRTCHDTFWTDDMGLSPSGEPICTVCEDNYVANCGNCGEDYWVDDGCSECGGEYDSGDSYDSGKYGHLELSSYSYKPEPRFHTLKNGTVTTSWSPDSTERIYMGVELELNCTGSRETYISGGNAIADSALMADYGFLYAKSDCTVSGPEIVSHPATLDAHRTLWAMFPWRELAVEHRWSGWRGGNAGIHIHVDRKAFTNRAHMARFQMLFGGWKDQMIAFSGRNCSSYGYFGDSMQRDAISYALGHAYPARGSAINYLNRNTIEVRMFRSSLKPETLMAYLEFLHGLVTYSGEKRSYHFANENATEFDNFIGWMQQQNNYQLAVTRFSERISS